MTPVETLRTNWSSFRWAYAFMAWFVFGGFIANHIGVERAFFFLSLPLFFLAFFKSVSPGLRGSAPYFHTVLWAMLGPFFFGVSLVVLWHTAAYVFGFNAG